MENVRFESTPNHIGNGAVNSCYTSIVVSPNIIVILGPTASGKSALGVTLAKKFGGVVISADSRQVYRGLDIGTAKITRREMRGVPHYLLDVASPRSQYSVARYVRDVQRFLKTIAERTPIFLVGGSPFYIDAVTRPGSHSSVPPNPKRRKGLEKKSNNQLRSMLKRLNPDRAKNIDWHNKRKVIRAIEVALFRPPPRPELAEGRRGTGVVEPLNILKLGLNPPRQKLFRVIDHRIDQRWNRMLDEVRKLHSHGLSWTRLDGFGLEYRYVSRYVRGKMNKDEAVHQLKTASHDFVRRQMTWWKRDKDIHWVGNQNQAIHLARAWLD